MVFHTRSNDLADVLIRLHQRVRLRAALAGGETLWITGLIAIRQRPDFRRKAARWRP
jgi:hypothetical protein